MRDRTLQDLQKETKRVVDGELDKLKIKVDSDRQLIMALEEEKLRHANQVVCTCMHCIDTTELME